jgi:putative membrane protein
MMWWDNGGWGVGGWVAIGLVILLCWGFLVVLTVWVVRSLAENPRYNAGYRSSADPDVVLAGRFARGEITEDELTRGRALLHGSHSGAGR